MSLVTTPGDTAANAYCDVAYADTYCAQRVGGEVWATKTEAEKEQAIITATKWLDQRQWQGVKTFPDGSLRWPRQWVRDAAQSSGSIGGYYGQWYLDGDTIPAFLEQATAEYAFHFASEGDLTAAPDSEGLESMKLGSLEFKFVASPKSPTQTATIMPTAVYAMIRDYVTGGNYQIKNMTA